MERIDRAWRRGVNCGNLSGRVDFSGEADGYPWWQAGYGLRDGHWPASAWPLPGMPCVA